MIQVARTAQPAILAAKEAEWMAAYQTALLTHQADPANKKKKAEKEKAEKKYGHHEVKNALKIMFCGKCAYCESQVLHIDFGDIEHFKPKSKFPNLCFSWENLLLSCGVCNSTGFKGDKFPDANDGGTFVNPVEENPADFFEFEFDPETGTANVIPKNLRSETTERELGLNRPDLVKHRSRVVKSMVVVALLADAGNENALRLLFDFTQSESEYSAFAKSLWNRRFELV